MVEFKMDQFEQIIPNIFLQHKKYGADRILEETFVDDLLDLINPYDWESTDLIRLLFEQQYIRRYANNMIGIGLYFRIPEEYSDRVELLSNCPLQAFQTKYYCLYKCDHNSFGYCVHDPLPLKDIHVNFQGSNHKDMVRMKT